MLELKRSTSAIENYHLSTVHVSWTLRRAGKIVADPSHLCHKLFETLPSGRRLRPIRTKTSRHKNSFFTSTNSLINKAQSPPWHWLSPSHLPDLQATLTYSLYLFGTTSSCCITVFIAFSLHYSSLFFEILYIYILLYLILCTNYTKSNSL